MSNLSPRVISKFSSATHVLLRGLPTTATSGDLRRAIKLAGVLGVTDASLLYDWFSPTGKALLTFSAPDLIPDALRAAKKITFTGCEKINASVTVEARYLKQRFRGVKGRADALNRGLLGSGPSAGFPPGKTVTVNGFPGRMTVKSFVPFIQGFQLANDETNSVIQVPRKPGTFTMFGRFVVVLASESEAQRLVRKLHCTPFGEHTPPRYITAAVLY